MFASGIRSTILFTVALGLVLSSAVSEAATAKRPNVLIISIDDLNDWTSCLGGHPQARTPNIDRLADRGTLFTNAHCQAPICTPSRASLVTGLLPATTGLYFLQPGLLASDVATQRRTIMEHFAKAGYRTMGAGKFVHGSNEGQYFEEHGGPMGGFGPLPEKKLAYPDGVKLWDWGPYPEDESKMSDTKVADWVNARLTKSYDRPFFMVSGFWRPHVPMYAPPQWFELFPINDIQLPLTIKGDRDDLPEYAKRLTAGFPAPRHEWFVEHNAWPDAVRAYLASVAFVDSCVGRVLDALDSSPHRDNTIVVLLSDHGWHLGEKERWAKRSLWSDSTRVPLIITTPDELLSNHKAGQLCHRPAGLVDVYPTLLELTGVAAPAPVTLSDGSKATLDGQSLVPLLKTPEREWDRPALTTFCPGNHSLRSTHWHFIRYGDGSEELYDHRDDPHEWHNVAGSPQHAEMLADFRQKLPTINAAPVISSEWKNWEILDWENAEKLKSER
jgi:choline-sulfatase